MKTNIGKSKENINNVMKMRRKVKEKHKREKEKYEKTKHEKPKKKQQTIFLIKNIKENIFIF